MLDFTAKSAKVVSLFTGCGGLDYGFQELGFQLCQAFDENKSAVDCYNSNHTNTAKVKSIDESFSFDLNPDIIIAGPPCQGFSTGGGYKENDSRNDLLLLTCNLITRHQPKLAVIENVAALTNRRNQDYLNAAVSTLERGGYFCSVGVYSAEQFGVAQRRKRTLIFARLGSNPFRDFSPRSSLKPTVANALSSLHQNIQGHSPAFPTAGSKHALIANRIGQGQKLCNVRGGSASIPTWEIPEYFGRTSKAEKEILRVVRSLRRRNRKRSFGDADPVSLGEIEGAISWVTEPQLVSLVSRGFMRIVGDLYDLRDTFNGKYRRLALEDVSPTVDTRFGDIQLFLHPTENRSLTVREAARLQGFPDTFAFPENSKDAFRLIGNAVPPPMSIQIAQACRDLMQ
ncbi:MAG: DNA cytosine methyltransferase [Mangrovicoccus sp.]|nr:DNA cytosine methyltransferase [Mangrovicoccus sp.]